MTAMGQTTPPQIPSSPLTFGVFVVRFSANGTFMLEGQGWPSIRGSWKTRGQQIDLVTGWLQEGAQNPWGRPVDIAVDQQGSLFISDDTAGVVYKLSKQS